MPDDRVTPGAAEVTCTDCGEGLLVTPEKAPGTRLVHKPDGSHIVAVDPEMRPTEQPKGKGSRYA